MLPSAPIELRVLEMEDNNVTLSWKPGVTGHSDLSSCKIQVRHTHTYTHTHTQRDTQTHRQRDTHTHRDRQTHTHTHTEKHTHTHTHTHTQEGGALAGVSSFTTLV